MEPSELKQQKRSQNVRRMVRVMARLERAVTVRLTPYQIDLIRDALANLVGEPLTHMVRLGASQYFSFGVQRPYKDFRGEEGTRSDWGMMVGGSCHWILTGPDDFSLGTDDFGPERERRDEHAKEFYALMDSSPIAIESVQIDDDGTQYLTFSDGYALKIQLPKEMEAGEDPWRFMPQESDFRRHLVLTEFGFIWTFRLRGRKRKNPKLRRNNTPARRRYRKSYQPPWRAR